jgi:L-aminopeptidase/D-esterase-like protein
MPPCTCCTCAVTSRQAPPAHVSGPAGKPVPDAHLDPLFAAPVEATEEAVVNALWAAVDSEGRDGRRVRALPHGPVLEVLRQHNRL